MKNILLDATGVEIIIQKLNFSIEEEVVFVGNLLEKAFPKNERRDTVEFFRLLKENDLVECYCIYLEHTLVGFYYIWSFEEFIYWEYIAVSEEYRSRSIVSAVFTHIREKNTILFVCEVERPTTEMAQRRIAFYERLGWEVWDTKYLQPPLHKGDGKQEMYLMVHKGNTVAIPEKETVLCLLYYSVYNNYPM